MALSRPRELLVALPPMRSNVNLSRIIRTASCCGLRRIICSGTARRIAKIARETSDSIELEPHRTLPPVLERLKADGYELVGLEQTTGSESLFEFSFRRKTVLVIGNERLGIDEKVLRLMDHTVEDTRLWTPLQPQRGHRRRNGPLRILPAVSEGIAEPVYC